MKLPVGCRPVCSMLFVHLFLFGIVFVMTASLETLLSMVGTGGEMGERIQVTTSNSIENVIRQDSAWVALWASWFCEIPGFCALDGVWPSKCES